MHISVWLTNAWSVWICIIIIAVFTQLSVHRRCSGRPTGQSHFLYDDNFTAYNRRCGRPFFVLFVPISPLPTWWTYMANGQRNCYLCQCAPCIINFRISLPSPIHCCNSLPANERFFFLINHDYSGRICVWPCQLMTPMPSKNFDIWRMALVTIIVQFFLLNYGTKRYERKQWNF